MTLEQHPVEIKRGERTLGWSSFFAINSPRETTKSKSGAKISLPKGYNLMATRRLFLSSEAVHELVCGSPLYAVFKDATVFGKSITVLHAGFPMFKTGEPELVDFGCLYIDEADEIYMPNLFVAISECAELLHSIKAR